MNMGDVTVLDGNFSPDEPCVILDAPTARRLIDEGSLTEAVETGLRSLYLTGKAVVVIMGSES